MFDVNFGNIKTAEQYLQELYSSRQKESETVTTWKYRLQALVSLLQSTKSLPYDSLQKMFRDRFLTRLCSEKVKSATHHKYDSDVQWPDLVVSARLAESRVCHTGPKI